MPGYQDTRNRQLQLMLEPVIERLRSRSIEELCRNGQLLFREESSEFVLNSMGEELRFHYPDFRPNRDLEMWHNLTLLQYMDTADGTPLAGTWIGLPELRGGLSRGTGFDKDIATMFARSFRELTAEDFRNACRKAGGELREGKADVTAVISYAPRFPVLISFWEGDDEFPPSGKVLVDSSAEHYLTLEAAGGACSAVVMQLAKNVK